MTDDDDSSHKVLDLTHRQREYRRWNAAHTRRPNRLKPFECAAILSGLGNGKSFRILGEVFGIQGYLIAAIVQRFGEAALKAQQHATCAYHSALTEQLPLDEQQLRARIIDDALPALQDFNRYMAEREDRQRERESKAAQQPQPQESVVDVVYTEPKRADFDEIFDGQSRASWCQLFGGDFE